MGRRRGSRTAGQTLVFFGIFGIRRCGVARYAARNWSRRCCWRCRWFWGGLPRGGRLLCGILVHIEGFRFPTDILTGRPWSAVITGGGLTLARRDAWRFLRLLRRIS